MIDKTDNNEAKLRGQRLIQIRETLALSRLKFCEKFGFANTTVAQWETLSGVSPGINQRHARRLVRAIEASGLVVTEAWLLYGTGEPPYLLKPSTPPPLNLFHYQCQRRDLHAIAEDTVVKLGNEYQWFEVPDDAMQPEFTAGDIIIALNAERSQWRKLFENKACLITLADGNQWLRILREPAPDQYVLINTNPEASHSQKILVHPEIRAIAQIAIHYRWGQM